MPTNRKISSGQILAVNGGSTSIKFALFKNSASLPAIARGRVEGIGLRRGSLSLQNLVTGEKIEELVTVSDHEAASKLVVQWFHSAAGRNTIAGIGHRIVHGGPVYFQPQKLTRNLIKQLNGFRAYDPEHLPSELALAEAFLKNSQAPQFVCFDTAFHQDMPLVARMLPIPRKYFAKGLRRYGFHGLSCQYALEEIRKKCGLRKARGKIVIAHLGGGASITAVSNGKSVDTSMGFTPNGGIMMATRSGDLDPAVSFYCIHHLGMTPNQFNRMISKQSGLLGISGFSSDMRELASKASRNKRANEAVELFCYQAAKWICSMVAALGGIDLLIFTGGIGENNAAVRARICKRLKAFGVLLNAQRNLSGQAEISSQQSSVAIRIVHANEEKVIAQTVRRAITGFKHK